MWCNCSLGEVSVYNICSKHSNIEHVGFDVYNISQGFFKNKKMNICVESLNNWISYTSHSKGSLNSYGIKKKIK